MNATVQRASTILFAGFLLTLAGCGDKEPAPDSGFNAESHLMTKNELLPFDRTYWNKAYDPKNYTEIVVAPVNTDYVAAQNFWEKFNVGQVSPEKVKADVAAMAKYTQDSFIRAAANDPNHRFKVVDKPGPKTIILEIAITQLVPSKAVLNAVGYVSFIPTAVAFGTSKASGSQDTGKGVIAIEARIRDGASGEIIGMFADREHPKNAIVDVKALEWWAPAKAIIDDWSRQFVEIANKPPGSAVKGQPNFELLVW
jgi:hypothetical protein